jgi:hypothetical protein
MKKLVDEVVETLLKANEWYNDNSDKATVAQLLTTRDRVTTYLVTLGTYVDGAKADQLNTERERKYKFTTQRLAYREAKHSVDESSDKSYLDTLQEQELADKSESYYIHLRLLMERMDKVDDAISQRISVLKKEKEKDNA